MKSVTMIGCLIALASMPAAPARAERLGEHPAVLQKRASATAGYDYASKFYPHPAWLYLLPKQPDAAAADAMATGRPHSSTGPIEEAAKRPSGTPVGSADVVGRPVRSTGPIGLEQPSVSYRLPHNDRRGALR